MNDEEAFRLSILENKVDELSTEIKESRKESKEAYKESQRTLNAMRRDTSTAISNFIMNVNKNEGEMRNVLTKIQSNLDFSKGRNTHAKALSNEERLIELESYMLQAKGSLSVIKIIIGIITGILMIIIGTIVKLLVG